MLTEDNFWKMQYSRMFSNGDHWEQSCDASDATYEIAIEKSDFSSNWKPRVMKRFITTRSLSNLKDRQVVLQPLTPKFQNPTVHKLGCPNSRPHNASPAKDARAALTADEDVIVMASGSSAGNYVEVYGADNKDLCTKHSVEYTIQNLRTGPSEILACTSKGSLCVVVTDVFQAFVFVTNGCLVYLY